MRTVSEEPNNAKHYLILLHFYNVKKSGQKISIVYNYIIICNKAEDDILKIILTIQTPAAIKSFPVCVTT